LVLLRAEVFQKEQEHINITNTSYSFMTYFMHSLMQKYTVSFKQIYNIGGNGVRVVMQDGIAQTPDEEC
jgi:hypothetical protein